MLPRAVGLQVLHPVIAPALLEHAPNRLWLHKKRSVSQMIYLAYTGRPADSVIRFAHEHVKGVEDRGQRYHAQHWAPSRVPPAPDTRWCPGEFAAYRRPGSDRRDEAWPPAR